MDKKLLTLCFVHDGDKLLLGLKKRGFATGRWNGFGGKVSPGESIEAAAQRELQEETTIIAKELQRQGILHFTFTGDPLLWEIHVFRVRDFEGEPIETEEMKPQWFSIETIPYSEMWADDIHWLPLFLAGKQFKGTFHFEDNDTMVSYEVAETTDLT
jgi:8-oxo-dGTP pyrophosphatase MutT (NUDIX family)